MIGVDEIRLLLTIHSGPLSKNGRHSWYGDVSREPADNLIKRGLLTREDAPGPGCPGHEKNMYCYYEVTDEAREYVTFIKELLNVEEETGPVQPGRSDVRKRSHEDSHFVVEC